MAVLTGIPVSSGLSIGTAVLIEAVAVDMKSRTILPTETARELARFDAAAVSASSELRLIQQEVASKLGKDEAAIFEAQAMMIQDPSLRESVANRIENDLISAEKAVVLACEEQAKILEGLDNAYLAARALDLRDIGKRLVKILTGVTGKGVRENPPDNAVIVAADLTPSDIVSFDPSAIAAIVLDKGGRTSHTAILARSLGIPAVVATGTATSALRDGDVVAVDGNSGKVSINPGDLEFAKLRQQARAFSEEKERLAKLRELPAVTLDGRAVELAANIGNVADVTAAIAAGANGVGLFRTEFLFVSRTSAPNEEEQFQAYKDVLTALSPHPVVIRTLDIGGDKEVSYLDMPKEANPFLGLRAIRLCLSRRDLFRTQLRALLRSSIYGSMRIMFPMISCLQELREAKAELAKAKAELLNEGNEVSPSIEVGIMVEIPSAAVDADLLAPECDFFSIGTNDLVQYTLACDRGNPEIAPLSDPFTPAVLRLIKRTIDEGHKQGIWVGMCGEMAGMPLAIPLLLAMGLDEFSMSSGAVPKAKEIVRRQDTALLARLWDDVKDMGSGAEIRRYLSSPGSRP